MVLLPSGVNPIAIDKYITSYHISHIPEGHHVDTQPPRNHRVSYSCKKSVKLSLQRVIKAQMTSSGLAYSFTPLTSGLNVCGRLAPRVGRFISGRMGLYRTILRVCKSLASHTCASLHVNDSQRLSLAHRSQTKHFHGSIPSNFPLDLLRFPLLQSPSS